MPFGVDFGYVTAGRKYLLTAILIVTVDNNTIAGTDFTNTGLAYFNQGGSVNRDPVMITQGFGPVTACLIR
jgi:hypothetical protein